MDQSVLHLLWEQLAKLITKWNLILVLGNYTVIHATRQTLWPFFERDNGLPGWRAHGWRLKFYMPIVGCVIPSVFIPGPWVAPSAQFGEKFALGLVLAGGTIMMHHLLKTLGADEFIALLTKRGK